MRFFLPLLLALLAACSVHRPRELDGESFVVARLVKVQPAQVGCGVVHVGSEATYRVLDGTSELEGKEIQVLIGCIELTRSQYSHDAGDLERFVPGGLHYLAITRRNVHGVEVPELPSGNLWFYLRAASVNPLRPNNSIKPKPLRGSA